MLAAVLADLEDGDDAGVIEIRSGFRLRVKPLYVFVVSELSGENHL